MLWGVSQKLRLMAMGYRQQDANFAR
ncbi:Protein of unknown function [Bacillus wiedmannii]|uniref:Uncharacterized protein n=1 Tax=Bacillus wiedmannii TaxID=1890302 RepID=A0AB37YWV5_9BACI|nr:Protein of unknown function [Bacillus wiedmannii]SCN09746.1 Protein of unknown function [Bacillus wiedmannii]